MVLNRKGTCISLFNNVFYGLYVLLLYNKKDKLISELKYIYKNDFPVQHSDVQQRQPSVLGLSQSVRIIINNA